ncbi:hypothetical protein DSO57_1002356 [Entomophthora muscae]|uniref:Uncharacterized protein n=1 Tax=Entomophthora muscae TaxID=34485 RepID=A0ACC2UUE7_9FUNG|nr:hypothetical protein DSO57_1002356 [Entomophthora muscae]
MKPEEADNLFGISERNHTHLIDSLKNCQVPRNLMSKNLPAKQPGFTRALTLNVDSLCAFKKRQQVQQYIFKITANIVCLQETNARTQAWVEKFGKKAFFYIMVQ